MSQQPQRTASLEAALPAERARLVRLCAQITGDIDAAEDLAQETLFEAWRAAHKLRDPAGRAPWLSAIARNVCRRWARARGRELARLAQPGLDSDPTALALDEALADDFDLEVELERDELATLLDRALALLPADTRAVLTARYVEESPQAEVAVRLGLSEGAVAMRLQRGKLALRRVLATDLYREAASYGLGMPDTAGWQETRIWCPLCGQRRLSGRFDRALPELTLRCPNCYARSGIDVVARTTWPEALGGVRGYRPALSRLVRMASAEYRRALVDRAARCNRCGYPARLRLGMPGDVPPLMRDIAGAHIVCTSCGYTTNQSLMGLALALPEGRGFWREHPRIRALPEREVEAAGRAALVTTFASVTGPASFAVVSARDTFDVLAVDEAPSAGGAS